MVRRVRRRESAISISIAHSPQLFFQCRHTEDEFFGGRQHIHRKGDFVLIDLEANPAHERAQYSENERHGDA